MRNEIIGAIARGWCSPENSHKEMDTTLAEAIANEVMKVIDAKFTSDNSDYAVTPTALPKFPEYDDIKEMFPNIDTEIFSTIYHAIKYSGNFA